MSEPTIADVAVIGGTGFYSFLQDPVEHEVSTPYGAPSGVTTWALRPWACARSWLRARWAACATASLPSCTSTASLAPMCSP